MTIDEYLIEKGWIYYDGLTRLEYDSGDHYAVPPKGWAKGRRETGHAIVAAFEIEIMSVLKDRL